MKILCVALILSVAVAGLMAAPQNQFQTGPLQFPSFPPDNQQNNQQNNQPNNQFNNQQNNQFNNQQNNQFNNQQNNNQLNRPSGSTTTEAPSGDVLTVLPAGCNCPSTEQYNPVCGSDRRTYANMQKLRCFAACGTNVTFVRLGVCSRRQDVPT